jgi:hypothetical protein
MPTNNKTINVKLLSDIYGADKVFEAAIDSMLSNARKLIMEGRYKEAAKYLRKVAGILDEQ